MRVACTPDRLQKELGRSDTEAEHQRRRGSKEEPVVARAQLAREPRPRDSCPAGDLEEDAALLAEHDLAIVERTGDAPEPEVSHGFGERNTVMVA